MGDALARHFVPIFFLRKACRANPATERHASNFATVLDVEGRAWHREGSSPFLTPKECLAWLVRARQAVEKTEALWKQASVAAPTLTALHAWAVAATDLRRFDEAAATWGRIAAGNAKAGDDPVDAEIAALRTRRRARLASRKRPVLDAALVRDLTTLFDRLVDSRDRRAIGLVVDTGLFRAGGHAAARNRATTLLRAFPKDRRAREVAYRSASLAFRNGLRDPEARRSERTTGRRELEALAGGPAGDRWTRRARLALGLEKLGGSKTSGLSIDEIRRKELEWFRRESLRRQKKETGSSPVKKP